MSLRILIAGGHGFIGKPLCCFFENQGHEVRRLSRRKGGSEPFWDPENEVLDVEHIEWADIVINLCGENIIGLWGEKKEQRFKRSRLLPAALLCAKIQESVQKPVLYLSASAIGYYGESDAHMLTEESPKGDGFFAELVDAWEGVAEPLEAFGVRTAFMRLGVVLGTQGGALKNLVLAFKSGLGGFLGDGKQWMSWIELTDVLHAFAFVIKTETLKGPINCVSPQPIRNKVFTKTLGQILHAPTYFHVPGWVLKLCFGKAAALFLASHRVYPEKLVQSGFSFQYPEIVGALRATCRKERCDRNKS